MPRAAKTNQPDPNSIYVCWQGGVAAGPDGQDLVFRRDERLRGDHPAVQSHPWFFVPDGTPRTAWPDVRANPVEQAEREQRIADHPYDVRSRERPVVLDVDLVRVVKPLVVGYGPNRKGLPESIDTLEKGQILKRSERVVEAKPDHFESVKL